MKKGLLFVAVIAAFSFASCKKDRTCTCTSTTNGTASAPETIVYNKSTKHDARQNCVSTTSTQTVGGTVFTTVTECELK